MKRSIMLLLGLFAVLLPAGKLFAQKGRGSGEFVAPRIKPKVVEEKRATEERTGGMRASGSRPAPEPKFTASNATTDLVAGNIKRQAAAKPAPAMPAKTAPKSTSGKKLPTGSLKNVSSGTSSLYKWNSEQRINPATQHPEGYFLYLPESGAAKLKWKKNSSSLREAMKLGKPIHDTYHLPNGELHPIDRTKGGVYLNAERYTLTKRGWNYDPKTTSWLPPAGR